MYSNTVQVGTAVHSRTSRYTSPVTTKENKLGIPTSGTQLDHEYDDVKFYHQTNSEEERRYNTLQQRGTTNTSHRPMDHDLKSHEYEKLERGKNDQHQEQHSMQLQSNTASRIGLHTYEDVETGLGHSHGKPHDEQTGWKESEIVPGKKAFTISHGPSTVIKGGENEYAEPVIIKNQVQSSEQTILNDTQDQGTANDDEHYYHTLDPTQSETHKQVNVDLSCTVESARLSPIRDMKTNQLYNSPDQVASPQKKAVMYVTNVKCQTQQSHVNITLSDSTQTIDKLSAAHDAPVLSNVVYCQFDDPVYDSGHCLSDTHQNNVEAKTIKDNSSVSLQEEASGMDKNDVNIQTQDSESCGGASEHSDPVDLGSVDDNTATVLGNRETKDQEVGIHEIFDDPK